MAHVVSTRSEIVGTILDGRTIVKVTHCRVIAAGGLSFQITVGHLNTISAIFDVEVLSTSPPATTGVFTNKTYIKNVVGITLSACDVSTTLCLEGVFLGY